jgi:class 3 adenylate cyclase
MVRYIHFKDPHSEDMVRLLGEIPTCPGTCIFMDINKSTDMKYSGGIVDWGRKLNNTFNFLLYTNHFEDFIVKGIGDEMMLYIPDAPLAGNSAGGGCQALLEDIFSSLYTIQNHPDPRLFLECKVSIHYCTKVYNISFFKGANDYYGSDIDLTARLMTKCIERRIVISETFYQKLESERLSRGLPAGIGCLSAVSDVCETQFKGVPDLTKYRTIDVKS